MITSSTVLREFFESKVNSVNIKFDIWISLKGKSSGK